MEPDMLDTVTEIAPSILKLQFEIPYDVQPVNIYVLDGEPLTLIDTGPIMRGVEKRIPAKLEELGFPPSRLERIILTHHHPDHMGLAARLKSASGAELTCHRLGERMVSDYWADSDRLNEFLVDISPRMGLDRDLVEVTISKTSQWKDVAEPVPVDTLVDDGDVIRGDPFDLKVIHTPGHCIDHICLYLESHRLLFTGDVLLDSITPNPDVYPPWHSNQRSGLPDYVSSLHKIRELDMVEALPGHGKCVEAPAKRIEEVLRHHDDRLEYIVETLGDTEMTVLELGLELLRFIGANEDAESIFLAMREVFGHLVILEDRGEVTDELRDGVSYYHT